MSASAWIATVSTAYCLTGTMADGSYTREASIAHNGFPLGTHVTVSPPFRGRRRFVVRDRIGWGTELDFWAPSCGAAIQYGRRIVRVRRGWPHLVARVRHVRPQWEGKGLRIGIVNGKRTAIVSGCGCGVGYRP